MTEWLKANEGCLSPATLRRYAVDLSLAMKGMAPGQTWTWILRLRGYAACSARRIRGSIASFTDDGDNDREDVYAELAALHSDADVIVPLQSSAVPSAAAETAPAQRDRHSQAIAERGRMGWQRTSCYKWRALVEADVSPWQRVIGPDLRS